MAGLAAVEGGVVIQRAAPAAIKPCRDARTQSCVLPTEIAAVHHETATTRRERRFYAAASVAQLRHPKRSRLWCQPAAIRFVQPKTDWQFHRRVIAFDATQFQPGRAGFREIRRPKLHKLQPNARQKRAVTPAVHQAKRENVVVIFRSQIAG